MHIEKFVNCVVADCGNLSIPDNGSVSMTGSTVGSQAHFSCKEGFIRQGSENRTCLKDGNWRGNETLCLGREVQSCRQFVE